MHNEGFLFNSGGLEVGVLFAQRCFGVRNRSRSDRTMPAMRSLSLTIGRRSQALTQCDQDDVLEVDFLANSVLMLPFVTCVEIAFAFRVAGTIL